MLLRECLFMPQPWSVPEAREGERKRERERGRCIHVGIGIGMYKGICIYDMYMYLL